MKRMLKALLLLTCLTAALTLTACHTDNDPWPVNDAPLTQQNVQPAAPTDEPAAQTPAQQAAPMQLPEETQTPGGEEEAGLNG